MCNLEATEPYKKQLTQRHWHYSCRQPTTPISRMQFIRVLFSAVLLALGKSRDLFSVRTFGGQVPDVVAPELSHQHTHQAQSLPGSVHHQRTQPISSVDVSGTVIRTVPVLVCRVVNVPVHRQVHQVTGAPIPSSVAVPPLTEVPGQLVNPTAVFGNVVHTLVDPVVSLFQNASAWFNATSRIPSPSDHQDPQKHHGGHSVQHQKEGLQGQHGGHSVLNQHEGLSAHTLHGGHSVQHQHGPNVPAQGVHVLPEFVPGMAVLPVRLVIIGEPSAVHPPPVGAAVPATSAIAPPTAAGGSTSVSTPVAPALGASAPSVLEATMGANSSEVSTVSPGMSNLSNSSAAPAVTRIMGTSTAVPAVVANVTLA